MMLTMMAGQTWNSTAARADLDAAVARNRAMSGSLLDPRPVQAVQPEAVQLSVFWPGVALALAVVLVGTLVVLKTRRLTLKWLALPCAVAMIAAMETSIIVGSASAERQIGIVSSGILMGALFLTTTIRDSRSAKSTT